MSTSENIAYMNLAQRANQIGPLRETLLGVLGIVGIGSTRVNIDSILNQTPSQVVQTGLQKNEQVHGVLGHVGTSNIAANDTASEQKVA
ncbi:MAG: hypothetical protein HHAS10_00350 [Candidatus Altimarinota bacterium]